MSDVLFRYVRIIPVPRAVLWSIWTEPAHVAASSTPPGGRFESPVFDLRPGGRHHYCARTAEGHETWGLREFTKIEPMQRIEWRQSFADASGKSMRHPMAPAFPLVMQSSLTFEVAPVNATATMLTLTWEPFNATEAERAFFASMHAGMRGGWDAMFDQIERYAVGLATA